MSEICLIDKTEHKSIVSLCRHLKKLGVKNKDYYDKYLKHGNIGICPNCGSETEFAKFSYRKFCNIQCSTTHNSQLPKQTMSEEVRNKISMSWKNRNDDWLIKTKNTIKEKYGMSYTEFKRMQFNKRLNDMSYEEKLDFYDKAVANQSFTKSVKYKSYMLGKEEILVQGYEPYVLDILQDFYSPIEIKVKRSKCNMVYYIGVDGKQHRYFPDIILPENVLIEVKSPYTLMNNLENTLLKMKASYEHGYKPILVVWELNSERMEMCKKSLIETISSQAWNCTGRFNDYPFIGVGYKQTVSEVLGIQM